MAEKNVHKTSKRIELRKEPSVETARRNVLFVGAHPDDIELGALGTIMRYIEKEDRNVYCIVASNGEAGLGEVTKHNRMNETFKALTGAGVKEKNIKMLELPDTRLYTVHEDLLNKIEKGCIEWKIQRVFFHSEKDRHQDHQTIYHATMGAARFVPDQLTFESNSSTLPTFIPHLYIDITKWAKRKTELLQHHESQVKQGRAYLEMSAVLAQARSHGVKAKQEGVVYAEAFEIIKMVRK
jgi:N-acetylglucosamine malate deacetylase 1